tara:strand:- start:3453 stop:5117 length:1665 start_codon:yes stop_codon:yes gene_type:complete
VSSVLTWEALRGAELDWLLVVTLRGQPYRFSLVDQSVTDGADTLHFVGGLSPIEVQDSVPLPGGGVTDRSATIEVMWTGDTATGWATLAAGDHDIGDGHAELSLWKVGTEFSARQVVMSGGLDSLEYGALHEPVKFTIVVSPWETTGKVLPGAGQQVTASTFPPAGVSLGSTIGEGLEDEYYPIVIGKPGTGPAGQLYAGSPGLLVSIPATGDNTGTAGYVLIAGHETQAGYAGTAVSIDNRTAVGGTWPSTLNASHIKDQLGRTVTVCTWIAPPTIQDGAELWVSWNGPDGGLPSMRRAGTMRGAGEVLSYLMGLTGLEVDTEGLRSVESELDGFLLDFHINDQVESWDLIQDQVIPLLPVTWWVGPRGLSVRRWPYDATMADAVAHLDADRGADRVSVVRRSSASQVVNQLGISFAQNAETDDTIGRLVYAPTTQANLADQEVNPYSVASARRHGTREADDIAAEFVTDASTARAVLDWRIRWESTTHEMVTYAGPLPWVALNPCDVVTVTDTELGWASKLFIVTGVLRTPGPTTELALVSVPDFIRDSPVT